MEEQSLFNNRKVSKAVIAFLVVATLFLVVRVINEGKENRFIGSGVFPQTTISVTGEGEVFAVPDVASFSFSVVEEASVVEKAQEIATEKINATLSLLKQNGVEERDIKTVGYNIHPRYEYRNQEVKCVRAPCPPQNTRVLAGYEVRQTISVKVRDTDKTGSILAGIGELGATDVSGINFTIDDEDALNAQARELAIDEAKSKAERLSQDLGVSLVRIINFVEFDGGQPRYYGMGGDFDFAVSEGKVIAPELPVGENKIVSTVNITYEIR